MWFALVQPCQFLTVCTVDPILVVDNTWGHILIDSFDDAAAYISFITLRREGQSLGVTCVFRSLSWNIVTDKSLI